MHRSWLLLLLAAACAHTHAHPVAYQSPQWRGDRFANPAAWPSKMSASGALKWRLTPRDAVISRFVAPFVENDGALLRRNAGGPRQSITWIGHATVLVQAGGVTLLTDPIFSDDISGMYRRVAPPGVALKDLPPVDIVVISHNHRDHLDEESVLQLGPRVHYVVPLGMAKWFRARGLVNVTELDWWQSVTIKGAVVTMVPAQHWSQRSVDDRDQSLWGGYVFDSGGHRVYFAGDTGYPAAFREIGRRFPGIEVALLPIGCYAPRWFMHPQHMAPEEAAQAFRELGARTLVPMHWGTFRITDEPMDEPPKLLYQAMGKMVNHILFLPIGGTFWDAPTRPADSQPDSQSASN